MAGKVTTAVLAAIGAFVLAPFAWAVLGGVATAVLAMSGVAVPIGQLVQATPVIAVFAAVVVFGRVVMD